MKRINFHEITYNRLKNAINYRFNWALDNYKWKSKVNYKNLNKISSFHNKYQNQRCFLIANGPSLNKMDLNVLENKFTIGLNRIYLLFKSLIFQPSILVSINELVSDQFSDEIENLFIPKFLNWNRRSLYNQFDSNNLFLNILPVIEDKFSYTLLKPITSGGTVTYVALQVAYYLGFNEVIIIGMDHSFVNKGIPNSIETIVNDIDRNHFSPNYFPKGVKWQLPDLVRSEIAYKVANNAFNSTGRKIIDATINGNCNVFEKGELNDFL